MACRSPNRRPKPNLSRRRRTYQSKPNCSMTDYSIRRFHKYSDDELIVAVREVSRKLNTDFIAGQTFQEHSGISTHTIERRFGTWKKFCDKAGLKPAYTRGTTRNDLLDNLHEVWQKLGRQPRAKEMKQPLSAISCSAYLKEFGNWYDTCLQLLSWKSGAPAKEIEQETKRTPTTNGGADKHRSPRPITLSLRYEVLKRGNFKCVKCGRSPANEVGVRLHVNHRIPGSKAGETELSNLQTTCSDCNLGKGNRHSG